NDHVAAILGFGDLQWGNILITRNDREDIGKLGAKGDIGFFIGYSADSCAYRVYNRQTKKIMETMNVSFYELSAIAFEQRSSKPRLNSMTSGHISSGLDLTYAPSTITALQPSEVADTAPIPTNSSSHATNIPITSQDVDKLNLNAMVDGNTFVNPFANSSTSAVASSSHQSVDPSNMHTHLKTTYKNLFDSIKFNRAHAKLHDLIYKNAQLRAWGFENTSESMKNTSRTSVTSRVDKPKLSAVTPHSKKLHALTQSHSVPQPKEFNVMKHRNVVAPEMFKINPSQTPRVDLVHNKQSSASIRTNPITNSQRHVTVKENVSFNTVTASSTGLVHTAKTRRPQPKGNTRNARVPYASKSSVVKEIVTVEDHSRTLLLSKNQKTMSSECNNIMLAIRNDKSKIVCDT
nr:integrase, catalytic region, zinc finger, CCHC-type, peptidase aspartic, catalytic [Tanacetum cinerariifolium]